MNWKDLLNETARKGQGALVQYGKVEELNNTKKESCTYIRRFFERAGITPNIIECDCYYKLVGSGLTVFLYKGEEVKKRGKTKRKSIGW